MRGKVIVGDGEDIGQALKRLRRLVCQDRAIDKWPVWAGHHAAPNEQRRRKEWLRALTCDGRGHGKRLRKGDKQQSSNQ